MRVFTTDDGNIGVEETVTGEIGIEVTTAEGNAEMTLDVVQALLVVAELNTVIGKLVSGMNIPEKAEVLDRLLQVLPLSASPGR